MARPSEIELLQRWRDGDAEAGEQLLARHFVGVRKFFAARLVSDCDELAQRTFLAFIANRDSLRDDAAMRAFLFGIARKQLARYLVERERSSQQVPLSQASFLDHGTSPSAAFGRAEQQRVVVEAIAGIEPELRPCVELFYLYGYKVGEVAEALELPLGTVKSRMFRGRKALEQGLGRLRSDPQVREAAAQSLAQASRQLDGQDGDADAG